VTIAQRRVEYLGTARERLSAGKGSRQQHVVRVAREGKYGAWPRLVDVHARPARHLPEVVRGLCLRPGVGFRAWAIVFHDNATGLVGRAVWTDENGEEAYSELRGEGTAANNKITGTFVGGTGRYAGVTGDYEFSWRFMIENEALAGPVNVVAPNPVTNAEFTDTLGRVLGRPTFTVVPAFALKLALGQMVEDTALASQRLIPRRLNEAGFRFELPTLDAALRRELQSSSASGASGGSTPLNP